MPVVGFIEKGMTILLIYLVPFVILSNHFVSSVEQSSWALTKFCPDSDVFLSTISLFVKA